MNKKDPTRDLIFRDDVNVAVKFAKLPLAKAFMFDSVGSAGGSLPAIIRASERGRQMSAGIRSLLAEREMLRKLVQEAYRAGDATVRGAMWHEGDFDPDRLPTPWEKSRFPALLQAPWSA